MTENAESLSQSASKSNMTSLIDKISAQYHTLCINSEELLRKLESHVLEHQQYQDVYSENLEWIQDMKLKIENCGESQGDRYAVKNKLERLNVSICLSEQSIVK